MVMPSAEARETTLLVTRLHSKEYEGGNPRVTTSRRISQKS